MSTIKATCSSASPSCYVSRFSPYSAGVAQPSETTALRVFKQWLDAFNSADPARIAAFWQMAGEKNTEPRVASDLRVREMTGGMSISHVEEATETHVVALMKENRGNWSLSTMDLASTDPLVIAKIGGRPRSASSGRNRSRRQRSRARRASRSTH